MRRKKKREGALDREREREKERERWRYKGIGREGGGINTHRV